MKMNIKHLIFVLLAIIALVTTWPHGVAWMQHGGSFARPQQFFIDAYKAGDASAFATMDLLVVWIVFMVWVVFDAKSIGLGAKWGWFSFALSYAAAVSVAFPLYLVVRERFLAKKQQE